MINKDFKYFAFRCLMDFVSECCDVTDADMNNYAGNIEITGTDEDGSTITITVKLKEGKEDGN